MGYEQGVGEQELAEHMAERTHDAVAECAHRDPGEAGQKAHCEEGAECAGEAQHEPFYIDYYISLAEGAELPPQQLLENFVIETENSCISLNYLNFQLFNPGDSVLPAAAPVPDPAASEVVLRLITSLSDSSTHSGMVTFQILSGLTDSLGNIMAENWMAELFDEDN